MTKGIPDKWIPDEYDPPSMDVGEDVPELKNVLRWEASLLLLDDLSRLPPA